MIESESLRFWVSMLCHQPGNEIPEFMFHLVPIYSLILFVITQAFHIFYSDQTELISVILSWSSLWVNPKWIFDEKSKCFGVRCKMFSTMFSTRQCFSLTFMKAIFTCAWAGNACLLLSIFYHNSFLPEYIGVLWEPSTPLLRILRAASAAA